MSDKKLLFQRKILRVYFSVYKRNHFYTFRYLTTTQQQVFQRQVEIKHNVTLNEEEINNDLVLVNDVPAPVNNDPVPVNDDHVPVIRKASEVILFM